MDTPDRFTSGSIQPTPSLTQSSGLMDLLGVAAVLLDGEGRIVLWSPQAEELFGYSAQEALGEFAAQLIVHDHDRETAMKLFASVMETGKAWAGVFPVRHKEGTTRLVEFRNTRLRARGGFYALGIATDAATLRQVERDASLSIRLVEQTPLGLAVLDTDLRYLAVNPALAEIIGRPAEECLGTYVGEANPFSDTAAVEATLRKVISTGHSATDRYVEERTSTTPGSDHVWSVSYNRLEDSAGQTSGVTLSCLDITDRDRDLHDLIRARQRLTLIAESSARVGTTLEVEQTARELADVLVPDFADVSAVDILDSVLHSRNPTQADPDQELFRALAVKAAYPTPVVRAADPPDQLASYGPDRLVTQCVRSRQPILISRVDEEGLTRIARDPEAAALLSAAGIHTYLATPLIARGEVLGTLSLTRARNPRPFDQDDVTLARELADRAAVCIDNARLYQSLNDTAITLQRSLLPQRPTHHRGLEIATRYQPAKATTEVGGDWFDVIPLTEDRTALVVGDVMGSGINAAITMGRLRTATSTLTNLDFPPAQVLQHLDRITTELDQYATCLYAVYDPHTTTCRIALAGHPPPVLIHDDHPPQLLDLPTGAPLGVGGVTFTAATLDLTLGDQIVLYTDGLVETRHDPIDERLNLLLQLLDHPGRSLEDTCDQLLDALRDPDHPDDVALLIARTQPTRPHRSAEAGAEPP
ncbi:PAS domain S-box-containing protein [Actinacidiphila yanglinensis]|uniref:protein-serine/threonine phosphatase n=1 Tax=Actinacidiphila yanglinensis TaxID=310779 RepID=A0A1H6EAU3_9ACTN|nr:PAS domain S-box-containing protein [Actinacidiphila yanglinensis]